MSVHLSLTNKTNHIDATQEEKKNHILQYILTNACQKCFPNKLVLNK